MSSPPGVAIWRPSPPPRFLRACCETAPGLYKLTHALGPLFVFGVRFTGEPESGP
jgi:hypothetical protein